MIKRFIVYLLLSLLVIELAGNLAGLAGIEPSGYRPAMNLQAFKNHNAYADRDSIVGVWHKPNDTWTQVGPCYSTQMRSNQFGARDNDWDVTRDGNLFLGSSFLEGFGINYGERFTELFENMTGREAYNAGMAGDFGPIQYYQTLKKLRPQIKFDTCFVFFILPTDDSLTYTRDDGRYRPYLTDTGIAYSTSHSKYPELKSTGQKISQFFYNHSYSYHLYSYFKIRNYLKSSILLGDKETKKPDYPYVKKVMNMFCEDYPDVYFYFVFLPTLSKEGAPPNIQQHSNMKVVDLSKTLDNKRDYLVCNSHWNEEGHKNLAQALYTAIYGK